MSAVATMTANVGALRSGGHQGSSARKLTTAKLKTKEQYLFISRHFAKHFVVCQGGAKLEL